MTEHSTARERTHLFSAYFAVALLAGVAGSLLGGWFRERCCACRSGSTPSAPTACTLVLSARDRLVVAGAVWPRCDRARARAAHHAATRGAPALRLLVPIALNAFLIGAGAGLVIPFMNLYFKTRFDCSSAQIGASSRSPRS